MKTILSKNNNGIVVKRGGKGFSPSVVWKQIEKEVISLNSKIDSFDRSGRGNSFYLEFKIHHPRAVTSSQGSAIIPGQ